MSKRNGMEVRANSLDDEIQITLEMTNSDMQARGWVSMGQAKELARKILGLVENWERMAGKEA